jgi:outer membrane receptor protein involved in Fe transport
VPYTEGEYTVDGLYIEFLVPLVSGLPFVQDLTFETAYRVDDFSTAGNVSAAKYGLNWTINDDWRVRAVVADSVRAPNIDDLYAGNAQTYTSINDPCRNLGTDGQSSNATVVANCLSLPDVAATAAAGTYNPDTGTVVPGFVYTQPDIQTISGFNGGNPDLEEESADTTTIGLVWTPSYVEGLAVSLDYYQIEIDNVISSVSATRLINECYESTNFPNAPQCNAHERFSGTGKLRYWYSYGINQSLYDTAGYDLAANYTFTDLGPVPGILNVKGIWTRRDNHEFQTTFASSPSQSVGNVGYNEDKVKLTLLWKYDDWIVSLDNTYLGEACDDIIYCDKDNEYFYSNNPVDAYTYVDMQIRYTGVKNIQFYLGIDNLTDKQPSYAPNASNEPNPGSHYTGGQYRVWDSQYTYFGFNYKFNPND